MSSHGARLSDADAAGAGADPAAAARAAGLCAARLARVTDLLRADSEAGEIPGAVVLVARDGKVALLEACGMADPGTARPMRTDAIFRIASLTKPLTVVAALQLMERGLLALADPVARFLPELRDLTVGREVADGAGAARLVLEPARRAITIQDLMRHTAGFTYGQHGDSLVKRAYREAGLIDNAQSNADLVGKLARLPLAQHPGSTFDYGMSTDVLGRLIEVVAGQPLDQYLAQHVTAPLGMPDTAFGLTAAQRGRLAEPRRAAAGGASPAVVPYDPARPTRWHSGGGGLLSSALDYARFAQMLLNGGGLGEARLLGRKSVDLMLANHLPADLDFAPQTAALGICAPLPQIGQGYGLGLGVRISAGLGPTPGSAGDFHWGGALGPYFWADPRERLLVVFMLQELDAQKRGRYRSLLRSLVYQALD